MAQMEVVVLDGVSFPVFLFKFVGIPTIFYCHFPDKLLVQNNSNADILRAVSVFMNTMDDDTVLTVLQAEDVCLSSGCLLQHSDVLCFDALALHEVDVASAIRVISHLGEHADRRAQSGGSDCLVCSL